jgi:hypothetical protein
MGFLYSSSVWPPSNWKNWKTYGDDYKKSDGSNNTNFEVIADYTDGGYLNYFTAKFYNNASTGSITFRVDKATKITVQSGTGGKSYLNGVENSTGYFYNVEYFNISAVANDGYEFDGWYKNGTRISTASSLNTAFGAANLTIGEDTILEARFTKILSSYTLTV